MFLYNFLYVLNSSVLFAKEFQKSNLVFALMLIGHLHSPSVLRIINFQNELDSRSMRIVPRSMRANTLLESGN